MRLSTRIVFAALAIVSLGLLAAGLVLGELARLQPCYLCNFQRLLYIVLAVIGVCGSVLPSAGRVWAALFGLVALGGVITAMQQSWMQYAPQEAVECGFGDPTLVERLIDWLGGLWPTMFMVTGLCKEKDWVFLGLTLANWSGICFLAIFGLSLYLFLRTPKGK